MVQRAIDYAQKNSSLTWFDYLWCRALKGFKGENFSSLESADMEYLLKLNEYLDIDDYITETSDRDNEARDKAAVAANKASRRR